MIEVEGNLWTYPAHLRVITTNGSVKKNGCAVMGRGCAKEAALRHPELPKLLGEQLRIRGNKLNVFPLPGPTYLYTFPVKHEWWQKADMALIIQSARELARIANLTKEVTFVIPRPGCGNGGLKWEDVKKEISFLPDNVHVITFPKGGAECPSFL